MWWAISLDPAIADDVRVRVQMAYPRQQRGQFNTTTTTNVPINDWTTAAIASTLPIGTVLQQLGDYEQYWWQPISDKEIILKPGDVFEVRQRIKCKRVDREQIINGMAQFPRLFVYSSNIFGAVARTLRIQSGYDISFCVVDT